MGLFQANLNFGHRGATFQVFEIVHLDPADEKDRFAIPIARGYLTPWPAEGGSTSGGVRLLDHDAAVEHAGGTPRTVGGRTVVDYLTETANEGAGNDGPDTGGDAGEAAGLIPGAAETTGDGAHGQDVGPPGPEPAPTLAGAE